MSETAPGLFVSAALTPGVAYVLNLGLFGWGQGRGVAIHPADWERVPADARERFVDDAYRRAADEVVAELNALLADVGPGAGGR